MGIAPPEEAGVDGTGGPGGPGGADPRPRYFSYGPILILAGALAVLLVAFSGRYGYHRDELYFLACGQHLAWGYPDQPPLVPLLARLMSDLAPGSLSVLRLPSALAAAGLVVLTGLIARELGGGRGPQVLAGACVAVAPLTIGSAHLLGTTAFGLPAWALVTWLVLRILRTGNDRLWLWVGLATGIGLLDSDLIAFLLFAVVIGLAAAGPRRPFGSIWLYAGGGIALVMWAPYLAWQAGRGWPELAVARGIAAGASGTSAPRWEILPYQILLLGFIAPVAVAGLVRLLRGGELRWARALGVAFVVLVIVFTITGGKPYYLGGTYPLLLGAGAPAALAWTTGARRGRPAPGRPRYGPLIAAVALDVLTIPVTLPVVPVTAVGATSIVKLNYDAGETIGWPAFVSEIAAAYRSLPAGQRASAIVLTSNYGEAGAVDHFGPALRLPQAYSGHMGFWYWGPPPPSADGATVVAVGFARSDLDGRCGSLRLAAVLNNHVGVNDGEQGAQVWICAAPRITWAAAWPRLRDLG